MTTVSKMRNSAMATIKLSRDVVMLVHWYCGAQNMAEAEKRQTSSLRGMLTSGSNMNMTRINVIT